MRAWLGIVLACGTLGCSGAQVARAPGNGNDIPEDAETRVHTDGQRFVDPLGEPLQLRCTNLDGWLLPIPYLVSDSGNALLISPTEFAGRLDELVGQAEANAFWEDWRDRFVTEQDFERMAALGFNCARLVVYHRSIVEEGTSDVVFREDVLQRIDTALQWGLQHEVYVILDLHSAPGAQNGVSTVSDTPASDPGAYLWEGPDAAAHQDTTVAIWRGLAERYADQVAVAGYDLLNEPDLPAGVDGADLPALYARIIDAVREVDEGHLVFVQGDDFAHDFSQFDAPLDDNLAYSFHAYGLTGWTSPGVDDLRPFLDLREAHDRPLWIGEFGENDQAWQVQMVTLAEDHDIGWALYPWKRKQTWFFNPVVQRIPNAPAWYRVGKYLAQPPNGTVKAPDAAAVEAGLAEALASIPLEACLEDPALANALFPML